MLWKLYLILKLKCYIHATQSLTVIIVDSPSGIRGITSLYKQKSYYIELIFNKRYYIKI